MMSRALPPHASLPLLGALALLAASAPAAEKITYEDHVFPIFEQSCLNCHNPDKQKGGLDLSNYSGTVRGGSGGKIADPGDGGGSTLFASITHTGENKMPPKGDKIAKAQADLIRSWIDGGLLETKDSTARKRSGPKIDLSVRIDPNAKPKGPPPMPEHLSLEPATVASRSSAVADMAASPWAPLIAVTGQKQVLLYNTNSLQLAAVLPFPVGQPETLSFHPSGNYLLAGGGVPGKSGTTITWDVTTGKEVMRNGKTFDSVLGASLRQDLGAVATGGPSRLIKLWDTQSGEEAKSIKKHTDWITSLAFSPDGVLLATADRNGGAWIWEAASGIEFHTLRGHQKGINVVRWRADSNLLATASEDGQVIFWELNNGKPVKKISAHGGGVLAFDYARDGHFISSGRDKKVKIWKPDFTQKKELPTFSELVVEVAFAHDGKRFFTADWNGKVIAWDAEKFTKIGEISSNPPRIAARIAWLKKTIGTFPQKINDTQMTVTNAENALHAARVAQQGSVKARDEAKQRRDRLTKENETLQQESNQIDGRRKLLVAERELKKNAFVASQTKLKQHRDGLTKAEAIIQSLQNPPLDEEGKQLAGEAIKLRNELQGKPEDADLKRRTEEAEKKFQEHKQKLAANNQELTKARDQLAQARTQSDGIQQELALAESAWKQTEPEWLKIEERRKQISERRKVIGSALNQLNPTIPNLEKAVQPALALVATKEKELPPLKAELERRKAREQELKNGLSFWQAAAVNHQALLATARHDEINHQQDGALAELASLTQKLATLQEQLAQAPDDAARQKITVEVEGLTKGVNELRHSIDQRAPELAKRGEEAKSLQNRYKELRK